MAHKLTDANIKIHVLQSPNHPPSAPYEVRDSEYTGLVLIVRPSGAMTFCLRYRNRAGKAKKFTIGKYGKVTATKARSIAKTMLGEVAAGNDVQAKKKLERVESDRLKKSTIQHFLDSKYEDWLLTERKSGESIIKRLKTNFEDWFNQSMSDITPWQVTSWRSNRLKAGRKATTINRDITALKAMLSKAVEWGDIPTNPLQSLKPLKVDSGGVIRFLTEDEEKNLRAALSGRQKIQRKERERYNNWLKKRKREELRSLQGVAFTDYLKPMVILDLNTGFRRGELFNLQGRDIDFTQRLITIRGEGSKSGDTRHLPLNDEAFNVLTTWFNQEGVTKQSLVFPSPQTGKRFDNISTSWKALIASSGIESFRFHDIRHSFASKLIMKGVDLYTVKELLGHKNIETTQRYAHLAPEHKAKAVELLNEQ